MNFINYILFYDYELFVQTNNYYIYIFFCYVNPLITAVDRQVSKTTAARQSLTITPTLKELHWLPIRSRITFKVATPTLKVQPSYLAPLIVRRLSSRNLRSMSATMHSATRHYLYTVYQSNAKLC